MLTESFVAATLDPEKPSNKTQLGIHQHDFQPIPALKSTFKKSSSKANCLAVSRTHVFAAQADKAVVHVYSRDGNNLEAIVPFPEKLYSIALGGEEHGAGILALGTEGGRIILWELGTGRQVSTPQHHLQATTCLAIDLTFNFLLSGSTDSNIHVWSIPSLLSFSSQSSDGGQGLPVSPLVSLSRHRAAITAVVFGHSASSNNIAVSASKDGTCIVWDYVSGVALHTYLLPSSPLCLALDPADRAVYAGYEDGSIQLIDFYKQSSITQQLYDPALRSTPSQPPQSDRWASPDSSDSVCLCLDVSYDGTILLSGHQDGKIHTWDVAKGRFGNRLADLGAPISNLIMLPPTGFPHEANPGIKLHNVVKPRYESFTNAITDTVIPANYTFTAQFTSAIPLPDSHEHYSFSDTLTHASFPQSLLDEALADLSSQQTGNSASDSSELAALRTQNASLACQVETAVKGQQSALAVLSERDKEDRKRKQDEEIKATRKKKRRIRRMKLEEIQRKKEMGEAVEESDEEMGDSEQERDLSSSSDDLSVME